MRQGDLIKVQKRETSFKWTAGTGIYLGMGIRGQSRENKWIVMLWRGRKVTFDPKVWIFEVVNASR